VITDVTAFYPNSGGQPSDRGTVAGVDVVDVIEREDEIVHLTVAAVPVGPAVGRVDADRRFDHMQQHTGQHILSGAFASLFGLETVGFHMGEETVTIDLAAPDITYDQAAAVERLACEVVFQNRPVTATFWTREDLDTAHLRKIPARTENIRIVEVDEFDLTPCGGTHVRATGEVGLIKIIRTERIRGLTRVEFVCGRRALADYRWKNDTVHASASMLSVHGRELAEAVSRLQSQVKEAKRELEAVTSELRAYQAAEMYRATPPLEPSGVRVLARAFEGLDMNELKSLTHKVAGHSRVVALFGSTCGPLAHLVFQKSEDLPDLNMFHLLKQVLPSVDGKGGGNPGLAQGGGKNPAGLSLALEQASDIVAQALDSANGTA
jgi:alanyl-tRNA synthetase